jgi:hypothetical protein
MQFAIDHKNIVAGGRDGGARGRNRGTVSRLEDVACYTSRLAKGGIIVGTMEAIFLVQCLVV